MEPKNHPFAKEKPLKKEKTPPLLCSMFIFRICILQNPEKSAEICKESEWPRLFWRHCSCCFRRKWAAEGGHELRWWHPTVLGAMPTKTDEERNLARLTVHTPKFNMEPGNFLVSKFGSSFSKGPPFSGELCLFWGDVSSNIDGTGLLTYWFIRTLEERIPFSIYAIYFDLKVTTWKIVSQKKGLSTGPKSLNHKRYHTQLKY